jgi:hypothetical protein
MKTILNLTTLIDGKEYPCEIYCNYTAREYFTIDEQPVDMKVLFRTETIDGYLVVVEDDYGQRMSFSCELA